ncbi:MAG: serine/threonine-protein kinase [Nannocystaceae bacterium]|nr:serine/threonine-protein kinase [Nannocystaceae bacterium]
MSAGDPTPQGEAWAALAGRLAAGERPGTRIAGRYRIVQRLGGGGMGVVYRAEDLELQRPVALKVMRPPTRVQAEAMRKRIRQEAQALARLTHPNVLHVFDVCEHTGEVVLVLEYVPGADLRRHLAEHPATSVEAIVAYFVDAARGLAAAHDAGIVHGDVKPDNILVASDGRVRVADFGLATAWSRTRDDPSDAAGTAGEGTPRYMAPEQLRGGPATPRSDQFAWCVALYEALHGEPPFAGSSAPALLDAIMAGPPRAGRRRLSPVLRRVLSRGLEPQAQARWPDLHALLRALTQPRRPARRLAGLAIAAGALATVWWAAPPREPCAAIDAAPPWQRHDRTRLREHVIALDDGRDDARWQRIAADLDGFATRWSAVVGELCRGVADAGAQAQAAALACPRRLGREVDARVDVLLDADARALPGAVASIAALPDPSHCIAESAAPPTDAPAREDGDDDDAAARVDAWIAAGDYTQALPLAQDLDARARLREGLRARAESSARLGSVLEGLGRFDEAVQRYEDAALVAEEAGAADIAARAAFQLVFLHASRREDADAAQPWFRHGAAAQRRAGASTRLEAELAAAQADLAAARGDLPAARAARERVVALRTAAAGPASLAVATAEHNLAIVCFRVGDYAAARDLYLHALQTRIARLGADHPLVGSTHGNLGPVYQRLGELDTAELHHRRALEIAEASFGPTHYQTAAALANYAVALAAKGDREAAITLERRALAILEARLGPDNPNVARLLANLGNRETALGHDEAAQAYLSRALEIHTRAGTAAGTELAAILGGLGLLHARRGDHPRAAIELGRAADMFEATVGRADGYTVTARSGQVDALRRAGDPRAAVAIATAALEGIAARPSVRAALELALAWAQLDSGAPDAAAAMLARARADDPQLEGLAELTAAVERAPAVTNDPRAPLR